MNFIGKITFISPISSGVSQTSGKQWASLNFVVTNEQERYPKSVCFRVFGQDRINEFALKIGESVNVDFDIDAHQYNERWFNELNAWRITRIADAANQPTQQIQQPYTQHPVQPQPAQNNNNNEALPF